MWQKCRFPDACGRRIIFFKHTKLEQAIYSRFSEVLYECQGEFVFVRCQVHYVDIVVKFVLVAQGCVYLYRLTSRCAKGSMGDIGRGWCKLNRSVIVMLCRKQS